MSTISVPLGRRLRLRYAPWLRNSNWPYREMLQRRVGDARRWLDLGCGHQLLPRWMPDALRESRRLVSRCGKVIGVDQVHAALRQHETIAARVVADIGRLPFAPASFDLVTANMVIEHVDDTDGLMREIHRVLAHGGVFLFHTPNRNFYQIAASLCVPAPVRRRAATIIEGRATDDVFQTHYRMNTRKAIETVARGAGFVVEEMQCVHSSLLTEKLGPLVLGELAVARVLESRAFAWARSNILVAMRKA